MGTEENRDRAQAASLKKENVTTSFVTGGKGRIKYSYKQVWWDWWENRKLRVSVKDTPFFSVNKTILPALPPLPIQIWRDYIYDQFKKQYLSMASKLFFFSIIVIF